jgi:hypothetical protein
LVREMKGLTKQQLMDRLLAAAKMEEELRLDIEVCDKRHEKTVADLRASQSYAEEIQLRLTDLTRMSQELDRALRREKDARSRRAGAQNALRDACEKEVGAIMNQCGVIHTTRDGEEWAR